MLYSKIAAKLKKENIVVHEQVNGALYSSFGSGGIIDYVVEPEDTEQLKTALEIISNNPYYIIGGGTNTLIADKGLPLLLSLRRLNKIVLQGNSFYCYAGSRLPALTAYAEKRELTGAEFLTEIPGTFGGAVIMNAGAFGGEIGNIIKSVTLIEKGKVVEYNKNKLEFGYRKSNIGDRIIVGGVIELNQCELKFIRETTQKFRAYRIKTQPFGRSLGSVFKRVNGISAAVYIEKTGLKGVTVGGAQLSTKHCNFIMNRGGATSADYLAIVDMIRSEVIKQDIQLELENKLFGYERC